MQIGKVEHVARDSIASELGIVPGDKLLTINGEPLGDIVDYMLQVHDEYLEMYIEKKCGERYIYEVEKEYDEDIGLSFDPPTITPIRRCHNNCGFCFVSQMPKGLRSSLYVKDDDYRLSFLSGSYITCTNLSTTDIERICNLHLSPLYVSVHRTDSMRSKYLGRSDNIDIMDILKKFAEAHVDIHTQLVLCPGINDGEVLKRSIADLMTLEEHLLSLAVVPVGLTKHREGLAKLTGFDSDRAQSVIDTVHEMGETMLRAYGRRAIYASDEFYLLAGTAIPNSSYYEGYPQLENGVGMVRLFIDECMAALENVKRTETPNRGRVVVTGTLAEPIIERVVEEFAHLFPKSEIRIEAIPNSFFGETVTVAGLLTGQDILNWLDGRVTDNDIILIPDNLLQFGSDIFLDDMSVKDVAKKLCCEVCVVPVSGTAFINALIQGGTDKCYQ